jgi:hypothetical protein
MYLIRKVEVLEVEDKFDKLLEFPIYSTEYNKLRFDLKDDPVTVHEEIVKGRHFYRINEFGKKEHWVIGATKEVQDLIHIQYEAFETMEKTMETWSQRYTDMCDKIEKINNKKFWQRVKYLFGGRL